MKINENVVNHHLTSYTHDQTIKIKQNKKKKNQQRLIILVS